MAALNNAVLRALEILDLLGHAPEGLRLTEIAFDLRLPESTVHRLLASLAEKGYVQQHESNGPYSLGWKLVTLAGSLTTELRLVQEMRPYLERIVREVRQTVNLGVLNDLQVTYLECLVPNHVISLYTPPGLLVPAYATSMGKALLAQLPATQLEHVLSRLHLEPLTPRTITSRAGLKAALEEVRSQGYAVDRGELHRDVHCVAAAITQPNGRPIAAISVTAHAADLPPGWEEYAARVLMACARDAGHHFFGRPSNNHRE